MAKRFCVFIILCVPILLFGADDKTDRDHSGLASEDYEKLIEKVFRQSPLYKNTVLEYGSEELSRNAYKFRWVTRPLIDSGYAGTLHTGKNHVHNHAFKNALVFSQSLPGGISLRAQAEQFFAVNVSGNKTGASSAQSKYGYDFDTSVSLAIPLYAAAPSLYVRAVESEIHTYRLLSEAAAAGFEAAKKRIKSQAVNHISSYLLLKERIAIEGHLQNVRDKEAFADNSLWETGKISSFELSERRTKRYERFLAFSELQQTLSELKRNLYNFGLTEDDMPSSIDLWITYWENFISTATIKNGLDADAEEKRLKLNFLNKAEQGLLSLPSINISAQFTPVSASASAQGAALSGFASSINNYWKSIQKWDCTFRASIKLSLFPFDREYVANEEFALSRKQYNNALESLARYRTNRKAQYEERLLLIHKLRDKALMEKNDAFNKIPTASSLQSQGYISETSLEYQKLHALLAENKHKELKLRLIQTVLEGY
ncbi:hypothetical protein V1L52_07695 [Treponema sp. HNW]|uniref:hypothetical protein n=1 Tax=Treponema sp. HNW TaxID=3116654 RepID=UPI003D107107